MWGAASPELLASRMATIMERFDEGREDDRAVKQERAMLKAIGRAQPATLGDIVEATGRGAPALSRAVDAAVKRGLVDRQQNPDNRRQIQLRLTEAGQERVDEAVIDAGPMLAHFRRLAQSELRAVERAIEILERAG